jgi:hypothetical protein
MDGSSGSNRERISRSAFMKFMQVPGNGKWEKIPAF